MSDAITAVCVSADIIDSRQSGKETELDAVVEKLNDKYESCCKWGIMGRNEKTADMAVFLYGYVIE